jgi:uncharacterized protein (TIGR02145 family)
MNSPNTNEKQLIMSLFSVYKTLFFFFLLSVISSCKKDKEYQAPITPPTPKALYLNPDLDYGSVEDIDGNKYASIKIGRYEWMAENLRTTRYCNGDTIPNIVGEMDWFLSTSHAWCHFNNDSSYEKPHGKLYNWFAVNDSRNICPCGWHVPNDADWDFLIRLYFGEFGSLAFNEAGGHLKSTDTNYWYGPNTDATNKSGFSALASGIRIHNGEFLSFGKSTGWWSSSEYSANNAIIRSVHYNNSTASKHNFHKNLGYSVRCIKD